MRGRRPREPPPPAGLAEEPLLSQHSCSPEPPGCPPRPPHPKDRGKAPPKPLQNGWMKKDGQRASGSQRISFCRFALEIGKRLFCCLHPVTLATCACKIKIIKAHMIIWGLLLNSLSEESNFRPSCVLPLSCPHPHPQRVEPTTQRPPSYQPPPSTCLPHHPCKSAAAGPSTPSPGDQLLPRGHLAESRAQQLLPGGSGPPRQAPPPGFLQQSSCTPGQCSL